jgi:hypothetical protein
LGAATIQDDSEAGRFAQEDRLDSNTLPKNRAAEVNFLYSSTSGKIRKQAVAVFL